MGLALLVALAALGSAHAAEPPLPGMEFNSDPIGHAGLTLPESEKPVTRVGLTFRVDADGEGSGMLSLDPTGPPTYDEFGFPKYSDAAEPIRLDCKLTFVKKTAVTVTPPRHHPNDPEPKPVEVEWKLYALTGAKVTSRLYVATPSGQREARFLVRGPDDKVRHAIDMRWKPARPVPTRPLTRPRPTKPCHPGCFPAGTAVLVPGGIAAIEDIRVGDAVTAVDADGKPASAKVAAVFVTRNALWEVKTDGGTLTTTEIQPLCLEAGGVRAAGELKPGDRVWRWEGGARKGAAVLAVTPAGREERVFNVVLADATRFVAGGFLARSKPPADPAP